MGFLKKLSGKKNRWNESDNKGKFQNTPEKADKYWANRNKNKIIEPFLLYRFNDISDAVKALMELECIKVAEDTEDLICTKELVYGYYEAGNDDYEAIISGSSISNSLFIEAKKSFLKSGGEKVNEISPDKISEKKDSIKDKNVDTELKKTPEPQKKSAKRNNAEDIVSFYKDEFREQDGKKLKYKIYKAPTAASALDFLQSKLITRKDICIFVRTPQGNYYRNHTGLYKKKPKKNKP